MGAPRATTATADLALGGVRQVLADYLTLTKPKVQLLLLLTTVTTMYVAGDPSLALVLLTCLGGSLSAGGAAAVNHYYDRDIDAQMARTATRPVPSGRVRPGSALAYGFVLQVLSFVVLATLVNLLAAILALCGFLGYVLVYTMWLKRSTPQNIVIGGAAGAVPPLVAWAAVTGRVELIVLYTVLLVALTLMPVVFGYFGLIYGAVAAVLGGWFISLALRLWREAERRSALRTYLFSLAYLALLFCAMVLDAR